MTDPEHLSPEAEEPAPFVPSPVPRRIWAWVGIAYVLLAMLLVTYWIATTGFLYGIPGIMLFPAMAGVTAQLYYKHHLSGGAVRLFLAILATLLSLATLVLGIFELTGALGGV